MFLIPIIIIVVVPDRVSHNLHWKLLLFGHLFSIQANHKTETMESTSFTKMVTTECHPTPTYGADRCFKMASHIISSPHSFSNPSVLDSIIISISQPITPTPTTPVNSSSIMSPPIKNVHSLDLEMRSRKRRRGCVDDDSIFCYPSPATSLSLPNLIPLEECSDSHETCLPDTSFLLQRKPLRRRR